MKCLLQELDLLNQAIYERKPLPSTQTTSKAVIDQLGKGNTQLIDVFQAAPLALLALAGQQAIQRRIFYNAYRDERWLSIASFELILPEIVDLIRLFSFKLDNEAVAVQKQRELEYISEKLPAFDLKDPFSAYSSSLDFLFKALADAVSGGRLRFSEFVELVSRGENCCFSDGFVKFVQQAFSSVSNSYLQASRMFEAVLAALPRLGIEHAGVLGAILSSRTVGLLNVRAGEVLLLCHELLKNGNVGACVSILGAFPADLVDEKQLYRERAPSVRQLQAMLAKLLFDAVRHATLLTAQATSQTYLQALPLTDRKWRARKDEIAAVLGYFASLSRRPDFCMRDQAFYLVILHILSMVKFNGALRAVFAYQAALFDEIAGWNVNFEHASIEQQLEFGLRSLDSFDPIKPYETVSMMEPVARPACYQTANAIPTRNFSNKDAALAYTELQSSQLQNKTPLLPQPQIAALETDTDMFGEDTKCDLDLKFV